MVHCESLVAAGSKKVHGKIECLAASLPRGPSSRYPADSSSKDATGQALAYVYARETKSRGRHREGADDGRGQAHREQYRQAVDASIREKTLTSQKESKTRAELEALLMDELKKHPECSNVEGMAITRPVGRPWDVAVLRDGPGIRVECRQKIYEITNRLVAQYDLVPD